MAKKVPEFNFLSVVDRQANPGVVLEWGALNGSMVPPQARATALGIIVASIDAESDAALMLFLIDGGSEPAQAEEVVNRVAQKRRQLRKMRLAESGEDQATTS